MSFAIHENEDKIPPYMLPISSPRSSAWVLGSPSHSLVNYRNASDEALSKTGRSDCKLAMVPLTPGLKFLRSSVRQLGVIEVPQVSGMIRLC